MALDLLESELSVLLQDELTDILGGTGGGSSSHDLNTIDGVLGWATDMGIPWSVNGENEHVDSFGNHLISPVDVVQNYNPNPPEPEPDPEQYNPFDPYNPYNPYDPYNSNYNGLGYDVPPEYSYYNILTSYINYFESLGYQFGQDSYGNYYTVSTPSNPYSNYNDPNDYQPYDTDKWERDENGNIIGSKTDYYYLNSDYASEGVLLNLEEVKVIANEIEFTLFQVKDLVDLSSNTVRNATEAESANCFGHAVADGKFWFEDNPATGLKGYEEFQRYVNAFYVPCPPSEASLVVLDHGGPYHAGRVSHDSNGNIIYESKGGVASTQTHYSETEFRGTNYTDGSAIYYKLKN